MSTNFPMFRLATLLARQMSSPVATRIKQYAKTHPVMSQKLCGGCATLYRNTEYKYKLWTLKLSGAKLSEATMNAKLPPLSPAQAIEIGGDLLGEIVIFILGASIMMFELNRQAEKQEIKEHNERSRMLAIVMSLDELRQELAIQQEELDRMYAALLELKNNGTGGVKSGDKGTSSDSSLPSNKAPKSSSKSSLHHSSPLCILPPPRSTPELPDCPPQPNPQLPSTSSPASSPSSDKAPTTDVCPTIQPGKRKHKW